MSTLADVAKKTGLSAMTVSRCFNDAEKVKKDTRELVMQAAKELNYMPNSIARSLVRRETKIIFVYIPAGLEISHPFVMQAIAAIGEVLGQSGYSFLLSRKFYKNENCDGIIAMGLTIEDEKAFKDLSMKKPAIVFGNSAYFNNWVDVDNYDGSYQMAEYVFNKGYKDVAYIGIKNPEHFSVQRMKGFSDCAAKYGIDAKIKLCSNDEQHGYSSAKKILEERPGVKAIVCASDLLAMGAMRAAKSKGLSVPDDIAVTGFDGLGYENIMHPAVTTVAQPVVEVGKILAGKMIEALKTKKPMEKGIFVKPTLKINGSA